ncbi:MAG: hypothetical protein K2K27_02675 [Muribaculaceae bacterium]|nr:hypothetical protein [Muribaculaceae bacterium]
MNKLRHILTLSLIAAAFLQVNGKSSFTRSVEAITPNIFRVTYTPDDWKEAEQSPINMVLDIKDKEMECKYVTIGNTSTIITPAGLSATLTDNSVVLTAGGNRTIVDEGFPEDVNGKRVIKIFTPDPTTQIFGGGERGNSLNLRGDTLVNYNRQNYGYTDGDKRISQMGITMPLFISDNGYALLFDDFAASSLILNNPIEYITENLKTPISYYFISRGEHDSSLQGTIKLLSQLTGRQELPPLWAMGYITSKYGYHNQAETEGVIDTLQREGYPVDGIVLDLYWYGKEQDMGSLSWAKSQWPDHVKMLRNLKRRGVNLIPISQPYVLKNGRGLENYNTLSEQRLFGRDSLGQTHEVKIWVGEGGMFDVSNPDTRKWLSDRYKKLTDEGVGGWWGDLGEPEVHPESMIHANGLTAREYHNRYGNDWSEIIYNLYKEQYPTTRLMSLMRGGTTGLQRFNVFPWSTDVSRSWGGMQPQIKIMLNSGMSGLGYMSHDVGGFAVNPKHPTDPELYVRWLQLGLFSPVLRTHATVMAEPYHYPEYESIIKPLIKERYRWLPYNYTLAFENATTGMPLVRPVDYTRRSALNSIENEYMWGPDLLVAPVLHQGATSREVILPEGKWVDYNNPTIIYNGPDTINYNAPLHIIPLFVKAGAVIPTADYPMRNTCDYSTSRYTLNYYSVNGCNGSGLIYEDDLKTPSSGNAPYNLIKTDAKTADNETTISISTVENGIPDKTGKRLTIKLYNVSSPKSITVDGTKIKKFIFDPAKRVLTFEVKYATGKNSDITIKY